MDNSNHLNDLTIDNNSFMQIKTIIILLLSTAATILYPIIVLRFLNPSQEQLAVLFLPFLVGFVYLASSYWIFFSRGGEVTGQNLGALMASLVMVELSISAFANENSLWSTGLRFIGAAGAAFASIEMIDLALIFPAKDSLIEAHPDSRKVIWWMLILQFVVLAFVVTPAQPLFGMIELVILACATLFFVAWTGLRRISRLSYVEKDHALIVLIATIISFCPAIILLGGVLFGQYYLFSPYYLLIALVYPILIDSTLYQSRVISPNYIFQRLIVYGILLVILSLGYAFIVAGAGVVFNYLIPVNSPLMTGVVIFILALLFDPLRQLLRNAVDQLFFKGEKAFQDGLRNFSSDLTKVVGLLEIIKVVRKYVGLILSPNRLHIYIYDPLSEQFVATMDEHGELTSDLRFPMNSTLVQTLSASKKPLIIDDNIMVTNLASEKPKLAILNAVIYVPFNSQGKLSGWIAMSKNTIGEMYRPREINFVQTICDQAALAIERAQVVANLEDRVREMNVLSRVSQGINITLVLDDILELIYAQTTQIISADDFHIILVDERTNDLIEIFYVQENDRITEKENKVISGRILEEEVIRLRRPVVTSDYAKECQLRSIPPVSSGIYAWIGVPLNAGAGTIGVLSLAKRDSSVSYTYQQLVLLQSIADQAAGAIVKARLLEETQRRARHLQSLNEVSRQLTSTLELDPLLKSILQSASEIINCESGGLIMRDESTDELAFKVAVGPVAQTLLNLRLSQDISLFGKVMESKEPLMVNDAQGLEEWSEIYGKQTGFVTHGVLIVPLQVMDQMIGAIVVINKRDTSSFSMDDQDLLTAFASQAGIAIENARLYQMTDQELADRVEELSVLQRIGRELNTSLDTQKATKITLEWAVRQSKATLGVLALVKEEDIQVFSHKGITQGPDGTPPEEVTLDFHAHGVKEAIENGSLQKVVLNSSRPGLMPRTLIRVVIPIRRETLTTGIILLEFNSTSFITDDLMNFLLRLSDQAAIAIANAQLYDAVQAANIAKSEFVSFVSHELKNPMTSIKGYTELIAAGAVGPINEAQANFLGTIRSNVERMATLVSDLADISRIEADRLRLDFKALNPKEMLDEVMRSLRKQYDEKTLEVVIDFPSEIPQVWGDRTRIIQVMTNLLSNACKYTPNGGKVYVQAEATKNKWDTEGAPDVVHMWVQDTGIGISEEDQKKIFQKFFRSEDPKTREAPGTGLGLSITKSLVEKQGGKIWFESEFRKGTTFHFTIPVTA
jgi:signal transduction histidine kinase/transcriptional regulator with GAF, ATPase, and Fis domain